MESGLEGEWKLEAIEGSWLDEKLGYPRSWIRAFGMTGREE